MNINQEEQNWFETLQGPAYAESKSESLYTMPLSHLNLKHHIQKFGILQETLCMGMKEGSTAAAAVQ